MATLMPRPAAALVLLAAVMHAAPARAQGATGTIQGAVVDTSGAPLAGASVTVTHTATGASRETATSRDGLFAVPGLPAGPYEVAAALPGFAMRRQSGLLVHAGQPVALRLELRVAAHPETITTAGTPPYVARTLPHVTEVVEHAAIANLPARRRNALDLALLSTGAVRDPRAGGIGVTGLPAAATRLLQDGVDAIGAQFSQEALQAITVSAGAAPAEYGGAGGATIQIVTRSGGNTAAGSVYEFFGDDTLNAGAAGSGAPGPEYAYSQFGGAFGGPLVEDRHFLFAAYDGVRATGPADSDGVLVRTDHLFGDALRPSFRFVRHALGADASSALAGTIASGIGSSLVNEARVSTIDRRQFADTLTWVRGAHAIRGGVDLLLDDDEYSFFVQDQWHADAGVTVNAGVRYELRRLERPGVAESRSDTLGPRIGVAFAPEGRRYVVRGGYGLFAGGAQDAHVQRANAGVEWEWMPHTSLAVDYLSAGASLYNGLSVELSRRFAQNHGYRLSYTIARVEDAPPGGLLPVRRHRFTGSVVYATDALGDRFDGLAQTLLEAWTLSAIYDAQTAVPSWISLDARVARHVEIGGRARMALMWEAFNLLNRANPAIGVTALLSDRPEPRVMQLAVRLAF